ncbi:unnamed protein product [Auanema sp. JU1783]|nr:unnamed protein product [Auanema sp. JU1783]
MFLCPTKHRRNLDFMIDNPQEGRLSKKRKKLKICESSASTDAEIHTPVVCNLNQKRLQFNGEQNSNTTR